MARRRPPVRRLPAPMTAAGHTLLAQITDLHIGVGPATARPPVGSQRSSRRWRRSTPRRTPWWPRVTSSETASPPSTSASASCSPRSPCPSTSCPETTTIAPPSAPRCFPHRAAIRPPSCSTRRPSAGCGWSCATRRSRAATAAGCAPSGWAGSRPTLAADRETPTLVAMHHPPLLSGIRGMDAIGLDDATRAELGAILERGARTSTASSRATSTAPCWPPAAGAPSSPARAATSRSRSTSPGAPS